MYRPFITIILSFFLFHSLKAQDTAAYYIKYFRPDLKSDVKIVTNRDSAEYNMYISPPPIGHFDQKLRNVKQVYIGTNNPKLTGSAKVYIENNVIDLFFDGSFTEYYPNGHPANTINYSNGKEVGLLTEYFATGNLYTIKKHKGSAEKFRVDRNFYLLECRDTTGKILAKDGNGNWEKLDKDRRHVIEKGQVVDGLEEGEWRGFINDTVMYHRNYHKGNILPTADTTGQIYYSADREPEFTSNNISFQNFVGENISVPAHAREYQIQGKVYVTFVIEKDGSLTNVKAFKGPDQSLKDEAERCIKSSPPWAPAIINHKPVRFQYTVPVSFYFKS